MFRSKLLFVALLALAITNVAAFAEEEEKKKLPPHIASRLLRRKLRNNQGSASGDDDEGLLEEGGACVLFNSGASKSAFAQTAMGDPCRTNTCGGGCCRLFNYLECDEDNEFTHLRCVCNENTDNTHVGGDPNSGGNTTSDDRGGGTGGSLTFPAQAGDCDAPTPFQALPIPGLQPCSQESNCTIAGECCVAHYCFCKTPNPAFNESTQCVPDP